jgi:hypothetical protein
MATTNPLLCTVREHVLRAIPVRTFAKFFVRINRKAGTNL